jgi:hypothetical protein
VRSAAVGLSIAVSWCAAPDAGNNEHLAEKHSQEAQIGGDSVALELREETGEFGESTLLAVARECAYDFADIAEFGPRSIDDSDAPIGVRAQSSRVGILFPYREKGQARFCVDCDNGKTCVSRPGVECSVARRRGLCPEADGPEFVLRNQPSILAGGCTVTAVGNDYVMTAPHCVPRKYLCSKGFVPEDDWVVLFDYLEGSLKQGIDSHYVNFERPPVVVGQLAPGYCRGIDEESGRPKRAKRRRCRQHRSCPYGDPREGIVLLPLEEPHGRGVLPALTCSDDSANSERGLWSYSHPLGAPRVLSGPSTKISRSGGVVRTDLFLEPGSSGAPIFDENGGLEGVFWEFEYAWNYCATRGGACNDTLDCPSGRGCGVVRASRPGEQLCTCLNDPDSCESGQ